MENDRNNSKREKTKVMSRFRERKLLEESKKGNRRARQILITKTLPFAYWKARQWHQRAILYAPLDMLVHECQAALVEAVDTYDLSYNARLATYASAKMDVFMSRCPRKWIYERPVPFSDSCRVEHLNTQYHGLWNEDGAKPTFRDMSENDDLWVPEVASSCSAYIPYLKDQRTGRLMILVDPEGSDLIEYLPEAYDTEAFVISSMEASDLNTLVEGLSPRLKSIIQKRYGLSGYHPLTLREIGTEMSVSYERVRQLQNKAQEILAGELRKSFEGNRVQ
jgi:RNA polymerase primary sigma factor